MYGIEQSVSPLQGSTHVGSVHPGLRALRALALGFTRFGPSALRSLQGSEMPRRSLRSSTLRELAAHADAQRHSANATLTTPVSRGVPNPSLPFNRMGRHAERMMDVNVRVLPAASARHTVEGRW